MKTKAAPKKAQAAPAKRAGVRKSADKEQKASVEAATRVPRPSDSGKTPVKKKVGAQSIKGRTVGGAKSAKTPSGKPKFPAKV